MEYSEWVRSNREGKGWTKEELGRMVGLSPSVIDRIETGKSNVTLINAFKISQGFGLSLKKLLNDLEVDDSYMKGLPSMANSREKYSLIIDYKELEKFLKTIPSNYQGAKRLLVKFVSFLLEYETSLPDPVVIPFPSEIGPQVFSFWVNYPQMDETLGDLLFVPNAVVTPMDAGYYLAWISKQWGTAEFYNATSNITGGVTGQLERGDIHLNSRIKFSDVLLLDSDLECHGKLINLFWNATKYVLVCDKYQLSPEDRGNESARRLADLYMIVRRWAQISSNGDTLQ